MKRLIFTSAVTAMLLSGCTVGPDYAKPEMALPASFSRADTGPQPSGADIDPARWWTAFGDPQLTSLIERALADNPDIAIAASRVRQARLQEIAARARGLPSVNANGAVNHIEFSKNAGLSSIARAFSGGNGSPGSGSNPNDGGGNGTGSSSSGIALPGSGITTYSLGFDASWELDIFGGVKRGQQAAAARAEAAEWNRRDAAVILSAEIAQAYFALRFDQQQEGVIEQEIARQKRAVEISNHNAEVGLIPRVQVVDARDTLSANQARIEPVRADIAVRSHAIALLLGQQPAALDAELSSSRQPLAGAPVVPAGLPSDLLRRRADVRAAERSLAATTADIGVAVADLYPKFSLTGAAQLISSALGNLFTGDSLQLTGNGAAQFPLLDFGKRKATVTSRKEDREQAYLQYRKSVLGALRDVEDPLAQLETERRRNEALQNAIVDAEASAKSADARFRTGFVAQDVALQAQVSLLRAQENLAASNAMLRQDTITLFKALGGGWENLPAVGSLASAPDAENKP